MLNYMPRAAVFTDLSSLGNCSGSAAVAVLSALGVEACLVPSAVLSAQTGFKSYSLISTADHLDEFVDSLSAIDAHFDAVCLGFINSRKACRAAAKLCGYFPEAAVIVDPILGDRGRRFAFVDDQLFSDMVHLAHKACVITPNITELCLITDTNYDQLMSLSENALIENIQCICTNYVSQYGGTVVVTGINCGDMIANVTADHERVSVCKAKRFGGSMSGTGDILCAIVCAAAAKGSDIHEAVESAASFISCVMSECPPAADRNFGIPFQQKLHLLINNTCV